MFVIECLRMQDLQNMNKRKKYIDALKGFAIICVVVGHIANGYIGNGTNAQVYHNMYNVIYSFHMPLFFTISGYCFGKAYVGVDGLRSKRIKRQIVNMALIYLLFSIIMGLSKMILGRYVNEPATITDILLIPVRPIQLHWYIYVLIFYYIVLICLYRRTVNKIIVIIGLVSINLISHFVMPNMLFDLKYVLYFLMFFVYGFVMEQKKHSFLAWFHIF